MKRLNPKTNAPFKSGDVREDGKIFYGYSPKRLKKDGFFTESWLSPESYKRHRFDRQSGDTRTISNFAGGLISAAKDRCKGCPSRTKSGRPPTNGKVTITKQWVLDRLNTGICEATGDILTIKPRKPNTASLDRIDQDNPDYTPENARIVTWQFNNMKGAYSDEEFIRVAKQLEAIKKKSTSPLPTRINRQSQENPKFGTSVSTGTRQDDNDSHHHCGADARKDVNYRPQESSRDSMGCGGQEVGTPLTSFSFQNYGVSCPAVEEFIRKGGHLPYQP
jgi:hypothetical protein